MLLTWTSLDSVTGLGGARVARPGIKLRDLMDAHEVLAIAGECPGYANQGGFRPLDPVAPKRGRAVK